MIGGFDNTSQPWRKDLGMPLLKIARMGHPVLRQVAEPVREFDAELARLASDMVETMLDAPGVGLAAPQVHMPIRLMVFRAPGPDGALDQVVQLVNPEIEALDDEVETGWEGCLSIPELRGIVPRHARIRYRGFLPSGEPTAGEAEGYGARIVQHELDHLDGVLYLDRMTSLKFLTYPEHVYRFEGDSL